MMAVGARPSRRLRTVAIVALVGVAGGGQLKQLVPFNLLPLDLTILCLLVAIVAAAMARLGSGTLPRLGPSLVALTLVVIGLIGLLTYPGEAYAAFKTSRLFGITLPALLAAALSVDDEHDIWTFVKAEIAIAIYASFALLLVGEQAYRDSRLTSAGGATIGFSRAAAFVLLASFVALFLTRHVRVVVKAGLLALMGLELWLVFSIASKGPLQAVVFAMVVVLVLVLLRQEFSSGLRIVVVGGLGAAIVAVAWLQSPAGSRLRLLEFATGDSARVRSLSWEYTFENISLSPIGRGWGAWPLEARIAELTYPHNVLLEIWYEAGVVSCVLFIAALAGVVVHQLGHRFLAPDLTMFGLSTLTFWLASAMVSGDLNDNRFLLLTMVVLAAPFSSVARSNDPDRVIAEHVQRGSDH